MEIILNFLVDNYLWFLIISLILIFGLIGYIVDTNEKKAPKLHFGDESDVNDEEQTGTSLKELIEESNNEIKEDSIIEPISANNLVESDDLVAFDNNVSETEETELHNE